MEQDCWQPPSLPHTNYRSLKTFGGATFRKPTRDSDNKRRTSALWFSRHHRGGDAMLHHRTLTPVVLRDWSRKLELTTNTRTQPPKPLKLLTGREFDTFKASDWVRPEPAPSPYLDTAVEPVNWPTRSGPRTPPGTRPRLPHENRTYNRALTNPLRPALQIQPAKAE